MGQITVRREIKFTPAYDKRPTYGIHSMEIAFYLHGPEGVIQFILATGIYPKAVMAEFEGKERRYGLGVMAMDLGYHSPNPIRDWQKEPNFPDCPVLKSACYYDGSSLNADPILEVLVTQGEEKMWAELERYYHATFTKEGG